jgi:hypothetical protein
VGVELEPQAVTTTPAAMNRLRTIRTTERRMGFDSPFSSVKAAECAVLRNERAVR